MHLPRHTIESHAAAPLFEHASFCSPDIPVFRDRPPKDHASPNASGGSTSELAQPAVFACATLNGFLVAQSDPLKLAANRSWSSAQGRLSHAVPVSHCSLLLLVGGGRVPRFAPNKVILWDEAAEYTPSQPDPASHHANSDDDDDDHSSSFPSRRASTIFSAGSEFDAYGRAPSAEFENAQTPISSEPSSACPLSTADSTGSLSDLDHTQHRTGPAAGSPSRSTAEPRSSVDQSMLASSLGIGRLQSSYLSDNTDRDAQSSVRFSRDSPDLAASSHSHAIMASSANLADPFAEDEALPPHLSPERNASPDSFTPGSHTGPRADPCTSESAASSRQFRPASAAHRDRADGLGLIDSVSSMATTDTHATAKRPPRVLRGREVAELEFSEAVRGVYATTIHTTRPRSHRPAVKARPEPHQAQHLPSIERMNLVLRRACRPACHQSHCLRAVAAVHSANARRPSHFIRVEYIEASRRTDAQEPKGSRLGGAFVPAHASGHGIATQRCGCAAWTPEGTCTALAHPARHNARRSISARLCPGTTCRRIYHYRGPRGFPRCACLEPRWSAPRNCLLQRHSHPHLVSQYWAKRRHKFEK